MCPLVVAVQSRSLTPSKSINKSIASTFPKHAGQRPERKNSSVKMFQRFNYFLGKSATVHGLT
jgi:hypothetical protein